VLILGVDLLVLLLVLVVIAAVVLVVADFFCRVVPLDLLVLVQ
jgi:hypothetical protein